MGGVKKGIDCRRIRLDQRTHNMKIDRLSTPGAGEDEEEQKEGFEFVIKWDKDPD